VLLDDTILPDSFLTLVGAIRTGPYQREGTESFLRDFGPAQYHSGAEYEKATGASFPKFLLGGQSPQQVLATDPAADTTFWGPQRAALAAYLEPFERLHLDGLVYPAAQMPTNDETIPGQRSSGPHSNTGWVNPIGVPAVVVSGGFYPDGLPFGLEFSARPWKDGDLLGLADAYEQATHHRHPPTLTDAPVRRN
jgi:amidase